jgi:hypothetical protein
MQLALALALQAAQIAGAWASSGRVRPRHAPSGGRGQWGTLAHLPLPGPVGDRRLRPARRRAMVIRSTIGRRSSRPGRWWRRPDRDQHFGARFNTEQAELGSGQVSKRRVVGVTLRF